MKIKLLVFLIVLQFSALGQPPGIEEIHHSYFTSYFSASKHIPVILQYALTRSMLVCSGKIARSNKFAKDPDHPTITDLKNDYKYSGYDKGHNMPAADNSCDETGMKECFYFSNMTPQPHYFNAGVWKSLETKEREYALQEDLVIFAGSVDKSSAIGADSVEVPKYMWKVIFFPKRKQDRYECYFFPNSTDATPPFTKYKVTLAEIEQHAAICFSDGQFYWNNDRQHTIPNPFQR